MRDSFFHCSFCGKSQREVKFLVAGPAVYICDECIGLCVEIITDKIPLPEKPEFEGHPSGEEDLT